MGQNVPRPTDNFIPILIVTDISQASASAPASSAVISQAANRSATTYATIDAILKRSLDVLASALLLVAVSPIFIFVAALVSLDGGGAFFGHARFGRNLHPFNCLKFRTMIPNAEATLAEYLELNQDAAVEWARDHKLTFDIRVTPVGRILRRTSLDELPQLWNVLRGDMSLVGPRPITAQEGQRYGDSLSAYAKLRPGITGLWQVSGRNEVSYEDRVALDTQYERRRNIWTDLSILLIATPKVLFSRRGAR